MSKYKDIDAALIEHIRSGVDTFSRLAVQMRGCCEPINPADPWRVVDARLQALRKKGLVRPEREGRHIRWLIVIKEPKP